MEFWLQQNSDKFQLPVKPSDYTVSVAHKNTVVNVIQVGDVNLIGNTGLRGYSRELCVGRTGCYRRYLLYL